MKLLVGLGNPGAKYARNRHNVGFMAIEAVAARHGAGPWRSRFQGLACEATIGGERCLLLKPQTYMNDSGRSVGEAARYLKLEPGEVVVIYDEIDLAPGKLKVKTGGGNAGHNGLRSISAHMDNDYVRVRIGVGHPGVKEAVQHYVLHDFHKAEEAWLLPLIEAMAEAAGFLAQGDGPRFMTEVARLRGEDERKVQPPARQAGGKAKAPPAAGEAAAATGGPAEPAAEGVAKPAGGPLAARLKDWLGRRGG